MIAFLHLLFQAHFAEFKGSADPFSVQCGKESVFGRVGF